MVSASDNGGVYRYPKIPQNRTYADLPAPERAAGEYAGEYDDSGARVTGWQPGFDYEGNPLAAP